MTTRQPKVSIVVATYNRPANDVYECLASIAALHYPNFEVILVDNSSQAPSTYHSMHTESLILIDKTGIENLGVPGGRNVGAAKANGDYIFFFDDDAVLERDCLTKLVQVAEADSSIGILGPLTYRYDKPHERWFYSHPESAEAITDVFMVVGAAFMVKRKVLSQIGLFDANYFLYHEEWDLSYRAQQAGYRTVCVNGASCWHKVSGDDYAKLYTPNRAYYYYRNFFLFAARHKNTLGPYDFLFRHLLYDGPGKVPSYFVLQSVKKKKLSTVKSYLQGIRDGLVIFGKVANT